MRLLTFLQDKSKNKFSNSCVIYVNFTVIPIPASMQIFCHKVDIPKAYGLFTLGSKNRLPLRQLKKGRFFPTIFLHRH